ncbi:hypothetical protein QL104_19030 [Pseudomonas piscis]|uniref:Uncharacterized protein n=1 Tax=Pseudomonas piscis TaxID=2614538 RepID=A0ABY9NB71_9PSED|nr:hypothetical protein [Pseudomonas piscis]WMN15457.1 hypothetical protein QL104_19030 [Pseudomonas piscis]
MKLFAANTGRSTMSQDQALKHNAVAPFTSVSEFVVDKPPLAELLAVLAECGELVSCFFKPDPSIKAVGERLRLVEFLQRFSDLARLTAIGQVEPEFGPFSVLNRYELEGSLVAVALRGGCHGGARGLSLSKARALVFEALDAVFPAPFSELVVYRLDSLDWCELSKGSTISAAYVVCQGARNLWWVLCVVDFD